MNIYTKHLWYLYGDINTQLTNRQPNNVTVTDLSDHTQSQQEHDQTHNCHKQLPNSGPT
jgi:hypothetical protein